MPRLAQRGISPGQRVARSTRGLARPAQATPRERRAGPAAENASRGLGDERAKSPRRQQRRIGKPWAHAGSACRKAGGQGGKTGEDCAKAGDVYAARSPTASTGLTLLTTGPTVSTGLTLLTTGPTVSTRLTLLTTGPTVSTGLTLLTTGPTVSTRLTLLTAGPTGLDRADAMTNRVFRSTHLPEG